MYSIYCAEDIALTISWTVGDYMSENKTLMIYATSSCNR